MTYNNTLLLAFAFLDLSACMTVKCKGILNTCLKKIIQIIQATQVTGYILYILWVKWFLYPLFKNPYTRKKKKKKDKVSSRQKINTETYLWRLRR